MIPARGTKTQGFVRTSALVFFLGASGCGARSELEPSEGYFPELDGSASPDVGFDEAPDAPHDVSPPPDSPPACKPLGGGGTCNQLAATGSPVNVVCTPTGTAFPTPSGGPIVDGTYVLVASRFYGECPGPDRERITWVLCGEAWSTVQEQDVVGSPTTTQHIDGNVTLSGASLRFTPTCPVPGVPVTSFGYDATATTLQIYVYGYGQGRVRVDEFQRQ
jgi:hypothetical protein